MTKEEELTILRRKLAASEGKAGLAERIRAIRARIAELVDA